ncbi:MAG TPA: ABC transporter ATP-binding protein [Syntrophorhabdaceae bacterium]|nr:ABC transporter ATP-binding protein [Syntrophorhabdaceae bacterium]
MRDIQNKEKRSSVEMNDALLRVTDLKTYFFLRRGIVKSVNGVSFSLKKGEILGLVGESACGKTVTGLSILRLVPDPPGKIVGGHVYFEGQDLLTKSEEEMRRLRGYKITMIQQNPDSSLNPVFRIGDQVSEAIATCQEIDKKERWEKAIEMLHLVRIASPGLRALEYPHQMSGGMRQRVAGAIALSCEANLLIADEPTTSLDVTTQLEYLKLLGEIQRKTGVAIVFITHDFGIVERICDRIAVMYAGRIVETGPTTYVTKKPIHPYTMALLDSVPKPGSKGDLLRSIEGQPPDPVNLPENCAFAPRCSRADTRCLNELPEETVIDSQRSVRCFHAG